VGAALAQHDWQRLLLGSTMLSRLVALELHAPALEDRDPPTISLEFADARGAPLLPALERLSLRNQAVAALRIHDQHAPALRALKIVHPCGVPVRAFELRCSRLEDLEMSYVTVLDGYGFMRSLTKASCPRLREVVRVATTVYLAGVA